MLLEINSFLYNNNHDGLHQLALAALVLRHGPSARLQGVAIVAGYEPPVQRSAYGRRDPRFDFCRRDPRFRLTPLCTSLAIACITNLRTTCTRTATALHLRTRTLSDMVDLDKSLYTSPHASTDTVARVGPDCVKLARNGCMLQSEVRLSLSNCSHQLHPCTVLTASHHTHTRPPDVLARIASPSSLSNTYSSLELRSSLSVLKLLGGPQDTPIHSNRFS